MSLPRYLLSSRADLEEASRKKATGVYYGEHRMLCQLLGEHLAFVDTRDLMLGPRLVLDGFWEAWVTLALARYIQPGFHCVDVGANYGYYTLLMATACGREGCVLACAPNPLLADSYLPANVALNGCREQVQICQKVIGHLDDQTVDFILHDGDFATSSLEIWAYPHQEAQTIPVHMATLDRLCANWPRHDLVKIDVEGAEALVWEGMQQTLRRFPHAAVVLELHLQRDPVQVARLLHQVEQDNYALRYVNYDGNMVPCDAEMILNNPREHWTLWLQQR